VNFKSHLAIEEKDVLSKLTICINCAPVF